MESNSAGGSNGGPSSYSNTLEVTSAASSSWDAPSRNSASGDVEENQVKIVLKIYPITQLPQSRANKD